MQLKPRNGSLRRRTTRVAVSVAVLLLLPSLAHAEDRADTTVTWFQERRAEGKSLTVIHPQVDLGVDLGSWFSIGAGYEADIVSGATPSIYAAPRPGQSTDTVSAASEFNDVRHSGRVNLGFTGNRSSLILGYSYGTERDYRSHAITATGSVDLEGKNTTITLSYTRNIDHVCDFDNGDAMPLARRALSGQNPCFTDDPAARTVSRPVDADTIQASLTQNLTPVLVMQAGIFGQIIRGFQSNPYRRVRVYDVDAQESLPLVRDRGAAFLRLNLFIPAIHSSAQLFLRGYADTWGVNGGSIEVVYNQYLGENILFRLRGRGYQQAGAVFFRDATDYQTIGPAGQYFTGDKELAPLRTILAGGKLSYLVTAKEGRLAWGLFDEVDIHINAEALWSIPMTETPPGGDVSGPAPDAIIAQVGLLLRY
jgi:hypothetical protein